MLLIIRATLLALVVSAALGCGGGSGSAPRNNTGGGPSSSPGQENTISIFPPGDILRIGGQRQFSGFDSTVGQYDVTWSVQEGAAGGTITSDGLYTAPANPGTFHLVATSSHITALSAAAPVTVVSVGFVSGSEMATARAGHTASLLADGRVLVAGGTADAAHSAELFVPGSSSFVSAASMVQVRSGHCAGVLPDGKVLIAGGADANGTLVKTAEIFDPATQTFTATAALNQARQGASCTPLLNGKVLIAGGRDSNNSPLSAAELYDSTTGTFSLTATMVSPRAQHAAIVLSNGKVLLLGGDTESSSAELFDPTAGIFTATGSLSQARAHASATLLANGKVLVLGGTQTMPPAGGGAASAPVSIGSAEVYDPATGVFSSTGKLLIPRDFHSAALLGDGTVLVAGGYSHGFDGDAQPYWQTMFSAEIFDPRTSVSTAAASLETDRAEHLVTLLNNGQALVMGGLKGFQALCCRPKPVVAGLSGTELYK